MSWTFGVHPLSQVSHSGHPFLMAPPTHLHISFPFVPDSSPCIYTLFYTHIYPTSMFIQPPALYLFYIPIPVPYPHFRFFWTIYGHTFATITIPHHYISYTIGFGSPQTPDYPISTPCPCLSSYPLFFIFGTINGHFFAIITFPHHITLYKMIL